MGKFSVSRVEKSTRETLKIGKGRISVSLILIKSAFAREVTQNRCSPGPHSKIEFLM